MLTHADPCWPLACRYVSGEDPLLGMRNAFAVVTGIQSQGVVANAKHWVNNNAETDRHYISENVDER